MVLWLFIFSLRRGFRVQFVGAGRQPRAAHRYSDETQGYYIAVAAFERGLYDFINQQAPGGTLQPNQKKEDLFDGDWREDTLGAGVYRFRLIDEGGKININRVNEDLLRRVFTNLGVDANVRDILVDSIMDWRDPDDLHRTNGAEKDYYLTLSPRIRRKQRSRSVEDLLWIAP